MEYGILSLIVPLLAIILSLITKDVILSLVGGILAGMLLLNDYNPALAFVGLFDGIINLFKEAWITKTILFMLLIGALIRTLSISGAVESFISFLEKKASNIDSPKGAMLLAYTIGVLIFVESSITALVAGTISQPLFDKNRVSREKLAYICDSSSSPICTLIPLNAWGALLLGLIATAINSKVISGDAMLLLINSIAYNFYSIFTLILLLAVILFNLDIGAMKKAVAKPYVPTKNKKDIKASLFPMVLPILVMILAVPIGLYITGDKDILKGSGSTSVYYAVISAVIFSYIYFVSSKMVTHKEFLKGFYDGISHMIPVTMILIFALLIGQVVKELGTAEYLAQLIDGSLPLFIVPLIIFWVSSVMAFATGTSWGTFSIMMPIGLSIAGVLDLNIALVIGAVVSGGIFGDHSSPISDTTIISSMAADCNHIEHVKTQLPYALIGASLASIAFLIAGLM